MKIPTFEFLHCPESNDNFYLWTWIPAYHKSNENSYNSTHNPRGIKNSYHLIPAILEAMKIPTFGFLHSPKGNENFYLWIPV